jgi:SAM-dependent methyltransferase
MGYFDWHEEPGYFRDVTRHFAPGARLLDVGCGNGDFVRHMRWAGWDASGQEIDPEAAAFAREAGAPVTSETIDELAADRPGAYDAVTMSHVIEHIHSPVAFLRSARTLLKPGGRIWVATPNLGSAGHREYGRDWMALDPPRHLVLFTRDSLRRALLDSGFHDVTFPMPWSGGGDIRLRSEILRDGRRPTMTERGTAGPDLRALVRPGDAEELVALATA